MNAREVHYSDYLHLDTLLTAQQPESAWHGKPAHDETLFIIIHQAYELWFKQLLFEVESVTAILQKPAVNDNSPELQTVVHRLNRVVTILKLLVQQIDVMETMTPMDFLEFRDLLRPASGFQSWQFKVLEARLGLKYQHRFGQEYYISQLRPEHIAIIKEAESAPTLLELLNQWLQRMPFLKDQTYWSDYRPATAPPPPDVEKWGLFFADYRNIYRAGLAEAEAGNKSYFDQVFGDNSEAGLPLSAAASRAALFIMLYRGYPLLQLPFQLLNTVLEIDEQLSTWRYRHMNMVHRIIGTRIGTGGSTGRDYLKGALDKHYIFSSIAGLTSFLVDRSHLPNLGPQMEKRLGFSAV